MQSASVQQNLNSKHARSAACIYLHTHIYIYNMSDGKTATMIETYRSWWLATMVNNTLKETSHHHPREPCAKAPCDTRSLARDPSTIAVTLGGESQAKVAPASVSEAAPRCSSQRATSGNFAPSAACSRSTSRKRRCVFLAFSFDWTIGTDAIPTIMFCSWARSCKTSFLVICSTCLAPTSFTMTPPTHPASCAGDPSFTSTIWGPSFHSKTAPPRQSHVSASASSWVTNFLASALTWSKNALNLELGSGIQSGPETPSSAVSFSRMAPRLSENSWGAEPGWWGCAWSFSVWQISLHTWFKKKASMPLQHRFPRPKRPVSWEWIWGSVRVFSTPWMSATMISPSVLSQVKWLKAWAKSECFAICPALDVFFSYFPGIHGSRAMKRKGKEDSPKSNSCACTNSIGLSGYRRLNSFAK